MSNKSASGFRRPARRFPARGWVLAEQTCIARGSPVHPTIACVEMPFPLRVLQDDGALLARHGVLLFAGEDSPQCPARTPRPPSTCKSLRLAATRPEASWPCSLDSLSGSLEYTWRRYFRKADLCKQRSEPPSIGGHRSPRSRICNSSSLLSVANASIIPGSSRWRGKAAFLLPRFHVTGRT